jgi:hypothetical protein
VHSMKNEAKSYLQIPADVASHSFASKRTKITNMLLLVQSVSSILHRKKVKDGWGVKGFRRKISSFGMYSKDKEWADMHTRRAKRER